MAHPVMSLSWTRSCWTKGRVHGQRTISTSTTLSKISRRPCTGCSCCEFEIADSGWHTCLMRLQLFSLGQVLHSIDVQRRDGSTAFSCETAVHQYPHPAWPRCVSGRMSQACVRRDGRPQHGGRPTLTRLQIYRPRIGGKLKDMRPSCVLEMETVSASIRITDPWLKAYPATTGRFLLQACFWEARTRSLGSLGVPAPKSNRY